MKLPPNIALRWLTHDAAMAPTWMAWLTDEERAQVASFGHPDRRREFVTGRAALRLLLADEQHSDPQAITLETASDGAVETAQGHPQVSLAHTGPHAVAVAAPHPVGVDLEHIQPRRPDLHRFLLHPSEYDILDTVPLARDELLVLLWTLKEATLKGLRTGFRRSPKTLRLTIDFPARAAAVAVVDGAPWTVQFQRAHGCWLSVARPAATVLS